MNLQEINNLRNMCNLPFEKGGKKAFVGEVREFDNKKYKKTLNGWIYIKNDENKHIDTTKTNKGDKYTYDNTSILVNKFHIVDKDELKNKERELTSKKYADINSMDFSSNGFLNLHKKIFGDIYNWSGEIRNVNISNGNVSFAPQNFLSNGLDAEFENIKLSIKNKDKFTDEQFINKAASHFGELIFIHPFRDGNGRTTRKFIDLFLKQKNIKLDWSKCDNDEWYKASYNCIMAGNSDKMAELFLKIKE